METAPHQLCVNRFSYPQESKSASLSSSLACLYVGPKTDAWLKVLEHRDEKRFRVANLPEVSPEEARSPERDCSLIQCCLDLAAQGRFSPTAAQKVRHGFEFSVEMCRLGSSCFALLSESRGCGAKYY